MSDGAEQQKTVVWDRTAELAAAAVVLVLWAAAFWAAGVDWASTYERNAVALDWLSISYKLLGMAALGWLAWKLSSRSMGLLSGLLAALTLGSVVVNSDWFDLHWLGLGGLFAALFIVAGGLVLAAYRSARNGERAAVVRVIVILFVVGVFLGPVNAISSLGINREWLFAEDFGQVLSLAVLAGYGFGSIVAIRGRATTLG